MGPVAALPRFLGLRSSKARPWAWMRTGGHAHELEFERGKTKTNCLCYTTMLCIMEEGVQSQL